MVSDPAQRWYTPPTFPLFEFDDSFLSRVERRGAQRWLPSFNGRIGDPAQNVQLGWRSASGAQVSVGTFGEGAAGGSDTSNRSSPAWMLSGVQFYDPGPPLTPAVKTSADIRRLSEQDELWRDGELVVDGEPLHAFTAVVRGLLGGYAVTGDLVLAFVTKALDADVIPVRSLVDGAKAYPVDPTKGHTLPEIDQEWQDFFRDRPDLRPDPLAPPNR